MHLLFDLMKRIPPVLPSSLLLLILVVPALAQQPVVVELFTSEGCSDCPPADAILRSLEQSPKLANAEIIPLGFHVDYWDHQGWRDRFSSSDYTRRQQRYAGNFALQSPYTPQVVVDGRAEVVGNDRAAVSKAISDAGKREKADVRITRPAADTLDVTVRGGGRCDVLFAMTESDLTSSVAAGENKGRRLQHSAVVRSFQSIGKMNDSFHASFRIHPDATWNAQKLRGVIVVQRQGQAEIVGAAAIPLN